MPEISLGAGSGARARFSKRRYVANQTGKRYKCDSCGSEFIVTRGGNGSISCCGNEMPLKK